jgi:uncharacterized Zn finger protein (UPF0148 family)
MMTDDPYVNVSCPNCESQYAVEFLIGNVDGDPDYCPFCGDEIPEQEDDDYEEDEENEDSPW